MRTLKLTNTDLNRIVELNTLIHKKSDSGNEFPPPVEALKAHFENPNVIEIEKIMNELCDEGKKELSAITWLGRGDFPDFDASFEHAERMFSDWKAGYLAAKPLKDFLPKGIEKLRAEGIVLS